MATSIAGHHTEWLSLVEVSGPFLTLPVLQRALPQGLEPTPSDLARQLRVAYQEWHADEGLHSEWARWVLRELLGHAALAEGQALPHPLVHHVAEHGVTLRPDLAVLDPGSGAPRLVVRVLPPGVPLSSSTPGDRWSAAPLDRAAVLQRVAGVRLGLVTNGETWTLVDAPAGAPTAFATWEAAIWLEERVTLDAFRTLLSARRLFGVAEADTLEALLTESASAEEEVTTQLGRQVRACVELLVDAFDRADRHAGVLFGRAAPEERYLAAVTVMMRLVFLLSAEERGLFLLGDALYDASYAVCTLRAQLLEQSGGDEQVLEHRSSAWRRLLATFRMVHDGVEHPDLRLPAYGGRLFDPARFGWLAEVAVDDRTVLRVLEWLQVLEFAAARGVTEARRLSYRALDVEQIGHVYEGLLDHTAVKAATTIVGLAGKHEPELAAGDLAASRDRDPEAFAGWVRVQTGLSARQVERALDSPLEAQVRALLLAACDNDERVAAEVAPYHALLRRDHRGLPRVWPPGSVYVTAGAERRSTGTYYTPKSLAEETVRHTLEPLVYSPGPASGASPQEWRLKPAAELLDLRICDMAMGSGAFLVAACRYLAERLLEAWVVAEAESGGEVAVDGRPAGPKVAEVVPAGEEDRRLLAHRVVADRCLFGVDRNPMAVDMAKLSLWLVTLAKDRPFSFLDHALRSGDSLLGVTDIGQVEHLHPDPARGRDRPIFDSHWTALALKEAVTKRRHLESFTVVTVADAEEKARLHREAEAALDPLSVVADVVIGAALSTVRHGADALDTALLGVADDVVKALDPARSEAERRVYLEDLRARADYWLDTDRPDSAPERQCLHWPLEFPEVFLDRARPGFHAIVGNPPFLGGQKITGTLGMGYREHLVTQIADRARGSADLVAYFFLRAAQIVAEGGGVGLLATNTIGQGDTREVGLDRLAAAGWAIHRAWRSRPWPGGANLEVAQVWLRRGAWNGRAELDGAEVRGITPSLEIPSRVSGPVHRLAANTGQSFQGSIVLGLGFMLTFDEVTALIERNPRNRDLLFPYLNGQDLNSRPDQSPARWVINFHDWPLERAEEYSECMVIVRERVKPERDRNKYSASAKKHWWRFERARPELYKAIADLDRVLARALTSKHHVFAFVPTDIVIDQTALVFVYEDDAHFGLLQSGIHAEWVAVRGATLETRQRYSLTDVFETFPQPDLTPEVASAGKALDEHRSALMLERWEGLTATYNRVHNPGERAADITALRDLHVALDHAVATAYGWADLDLGHGFHDTRQGLRFTLAPTPRTELLDRLLDLNHTRHTTELRTGLHTPKRKRRPSSGGQDSLL